MAKVTEVTAQKKLLTQLSVPFFIMIAFTIGVFIFGTLYFSGQFQDDDTSRNIAATVDEVANVAMSLTTRMYMSRDRANEAAASFVFDEAIAEELRTILASNGALLVLNFFGTDGQQVFEMHKARTEDGILKAAFQSDIHVGNLRSTKEPYVLLSYSVERETVTVYSVSPVLSKEGVLMGGLIAAFDGDDIAKTVEKSLASAPAKVSIIDGKTGQQLYLKNALPHLIPLDGMTFENLRLLFKEERHRYGYENTDEERIEGIWERIQETPWIVVVEMPARIAPEHSITIFIVSALLLLIFIGFVFYYLSLMNKELVGPLRAIEKVMNYYRTGDYTEEIKLTVTNEFVEVADLLNQMAKYITENTSGRVTELKKTLERQNTDTRLLIEKDVQLREKSRQLEELDKAKTMFVSVAAHQMRTPLAAVKWALKMVADGDVGPVNPEQKDYLMKGYASTTRMIDLINDLLDVDKIESDKFNYEFKPEKLTDIVQGVIDDLTPISEEKGVHLIYHDNSGSLYTINADKVKLTNAIQNLVDNAIKYTIGGGDVTVTLTIEQGMYKLAIADTGIGIPLPEQGKVFGKFFRAQNAVRKNTDGSGLGLFIVKKIVEKHVGTITFESKEGRGTTFFITLPLIRPRS